LDRELINRQSHSRDVFGISGRFCANIALHPIGGTLSEAPPLYPASGRISAFVRQDAMSPRPEQSRIFKPADESSNGDQSLLQSIRSVRLVPHKLASVVEQSLVPAA
ncbi:MAG: hypothetical protein L0Y42_04775, partial [Phycisphaerales bacterium]|nr:hypothetical protein [Phycisphaerales bacterium]